MPGSASFVIYCEHGRVKLTIDSGAKDALLNVFDELGVPTGKVYVPVGELYSMLQVAMQWKMRQPEAEQGE